MDEEEMSADERAVKKRAADNIKKYKAVFDALDD